MEYFTCDNNVCATIDNHTLLDVSNAYLHQYEPTTIMIGSFSMASIIVHFFPNVGKSITWFYLGSLMLSCAFGIYDHYQRTG